SVRRRRHPVDAAALVRGRPADRRLLRGGHRRLRLAASSRGCAAPGGPRAPAPAPRRVVCGGSPCGLTSPAFMTQIRPRALYSFRRMLLVLLLTVIAP